MAAAPNGVTVTSCVKATEHHSYTLSISRWCWRSRGQTAASAGGSWLQVDRMRVCS
jgi:hypothetical protein